MNTTLKTLSLVLLALLANGACAQTCSSFRQCDNMGRAASEAGNLGQAQSYYQQACFMQARKPLLNLRNNSCRSVTRISGEIDNYVSAHQFFSSACANGQDAGCFHVALLEKDRGNVKLAMDLMKPLCDKDYIIHKNVHSSGCTEYETLQRVWERNNPKQPREPRDGYLQVVILGATILLVVVSIVLAFFRKNPASLLLSGLAFACYAFYESGVSPYASIRIDLLVLAPLLLLNLVTFLLSLFRLAKRRE